MRKKTLFIFNPNSGKGKLKHLLFDIVNRFSIAGSDVTVYPTQKSGDCALKVSESAAEYDMLVIAGGDGTLNEAVSGMLTLPEDARIPIGYIPSGTMNDFASTNNIPPVPRDAIEEILNNKPIPYDIGLFNDKDFIYVAAFGAFTDVSYATPQASKNVLGATAYFLEGLKSLPKIKSTNVKISTNEGECFTADASLLLIMNSTSVAGFGFGEFYDIDTSDGMFEIVVVSKSVNILEVPIILNKLRTGNTDLNGIKFIKTSGAKIETDTPVKWTLDGEFGGETEEVNFRVAHNAVRFFANNNT